ncbi:MAG TPA: glycosyltransferase [Geobacter sp.]|nr:glycosyltransferase [Geobacter sp.]
MMTSLPKITIVTPSYNQASFLEETIKSVILQEYPNLEYIILDGGSNDGSVEIIQKYAEHLTYWQSAKDNGQADAIARGFSMATGDIIAWLNSDDVLLPNALEKVGAYFAGHPEEECVVGGCLHIDEAGHVIQNRDRLPTFTYGVRVTFDKLLFCGCGFNQPASFWKRSAFESAGGIDTSMRFCFDYDMFFRLARRRPFGVIKDFLACFRIHGESKTSTLQDVCATENERLWLKYGRDKVPAVQRNVLHFCYYWQHMILNRYYLTMVMLGRLKLPLRSSQ